MSLLITALATNHHRIPPEVEEGNIEYKEKLLVEVNSERFQQLCTQLKWRLSEGHGEAVYELGVTDNGQLLGMTDSEFQQSIKTLREMATSLGAEISLIRERSVPKELRLNSNVRRHGPLVTENKYDGQSITVEDEYKVAEVLIRKVGDDHHFMEIRVAFLGASNSGKSTLLGYLSHGELDNGRGKARLNLLRHRHEIESGVSSSISHSLIGFNSRGDLINYGTADKHVGAEHSLDGQEVKTYGNLLEGQIVDNSSKLVMLIDTCGLPKYLTTTISGLTSYSPDYACLVVDGHSGQLESTSRELLGCALVLNVPVFVVITKIDLITDASVLKRTLDQLLKLLMLPGYNRLPKVVSNEDDVVTCTQQFITSRLVPIFIGSCVSGDNLILLVKFLNLIPARGAFPDVQTPFTRSSTLSPATDTDEEDYGEEIEFQIEDVFSVPDTGTVVGGRMVCGELLSNLHIKHHDSNQLYLGPVDSESGSFIPVRVTSIHRQRRAVRRVSQGQSCTLALHDLDRNQIRKGMVIVARQNPVAYTEFSALVCVLYAPDETYAAINCPEEGIRLVLDEFNRKRKSSTSAVTAQLEQSQQGSLLLRRKSPERLRKPRWGYVHIGTVYQAALIMDCKLVDAVNLLPGPAILAPILTSTPTRTSQTLSVKTSATDQPQSLSSQIDNNKQVLISTASKYQMRFRFARTKEYLRPGARLLYREGQSVQSGGKRTHGIKMVGEVQQVFE